MTFERANYSPDLAQFATERQSEYLNGIIKHGGAVIETFNVLAPNDRWAHDSGYRSRRAITAVLRSRTYGEVGRRTLSIEEVRDSLLRAGIEAQPKKQAFVA